MAGNWNRPGPVPLGLVETVAAGTYARYGHFPAGYVEWAKRYSPNGIPRRVYELAEVLRHQRAWEVPEDRNPGMTRIHFGPHVFLVPTTEILPP